MKTSPSNGGSNCDGHASLNEDGLKMFTFLLDMHNYVVSWLWGKVHFFETIETLPWYPKWIRNGVPFTVKT